MAAWLTTAFVTFLLFSIALALLGIGSILTGKSRLSRGCGGAPRDGEKSCDQKSGCSLCKPEKEEN